MSCLNVAEKFSIGEAQKAKFNKNKVCLCLSERETDRTYGDTPSPVFWMWAVLIGV